MGQGFSVNARRLAEGSQDSAGLLGRCEAIAADEVQAITGMGGAAGHVSLASALSGAAEQGTKAFLDLGNRLPACSRRADHDGPHVHQDLN